MRNKAAKSATAIFWDPSTKDIEAERLEALDAVIHLAGKALDEQRWTPKVMVHEELSGPVNVLTPAPVTGAEFARTLSRILQKPRFLRVPRLVLRLAMGEAADALVEGDANLRPVKLTASGFVVLYPNLESALRHELSV